MDWLSELHVAKNEVRMVRGRLFVKANQLHALGLMPDFTEDLFELCEILSDAEEDIHKAIDLKIDQDVKFSDDMSRGILSSLLSRG